MIIEEKKQKTRVVEVKTQEHKLTLDGRKNLSITGVENIEGFSDTTVTLDTDMGRMVIKGENLHICIGHDLAASFYGNRIRGIATSKVDIAVERRCKGFGDVHAAGASQNIEFLAVSVLIYFFQ